MIIDLILDRKDGQPYNAREFYNDVMQYAETWPELANPITRAMDEGDENDVRRELCAYIDGQEYNPAIKEYINSVQWLEDDKRPELHNLTTAATKAEENGEKIKIGSFETFADFLSYYRHHYRPILERLQDNRLDFDDTNLLRFFAIDMLAAFEEGDE